MIVKVQISQFSSDNIERLLVYDESRKFMYETEESKEIKPIKELMKGQAKAFFNAALIGSEFNILSSAEWQDW